MRITDLGAGGEDWECAGGQVVALKTPKALIGVRFRGKYGLGLELSSEARSVIFKSPLIATHDCAVATEGTMRPKKTGTTGKMI